MDRRKVGGGGGLGTFLCLPLQGESGGDGSDLERMRGKLGTKAIVGVKQWVGLKGKLSAKRGRMLIEDSCSVVTHIFTLFFTTVDTQ